MHIRIDKKFDNITSLSQHKIYSIYFIIVIPINVTLNTIKM